MYTINTQERLENLQGLNSNYQKKFVEAVASIVDSGLTDDEKEKLITYLYKKMTDTIDTVNTYVNVLANKEPSTPKINLHI